MDSLIDVLNKVAPGVIATLGGINPLLGMVATVFFLALSAYIGYKATLGRWAKEKELSNGQVAKNTAGDQSVAKNVQDGLNNFLDKK